MSTLRLLSWNVNGLRAIAKKGFEDWIKKDMPDVLCLQETKVTPDQVPPQIKSIPGYHTLFGTSARKGRDGVALFSKFEPRSIKNNLEIPGLDDEGRAIVADFGSFLLYNIYFPNGKASTERLAYKLLFYDQFLEHINALRSQGKRIVVCGDVNTAHKEIDLARPKANLKISGFLPIERAWIDRLVESGFLDTFRLFHPDEESYSYWDMKSRARERNVGWRIDYFFVSENLKDAVQSAFILKDIMGADHCPVGIELNVD